MVGPSARVAEVRQFILTEGRERLFPDQLVKTAEEWLNPPPKYEWPPRAPKVPAELTWSELVNQIPDSELLQWFLYTFNYDFRGDHLGRGLFQIGSLQDEILYA